MKLLHIVVGVFGFTSVLGFGNGNCLSKYKTPNPDTLTGGWTSECLDDQGNLYLYFGPTGLIGARKINLDGSNLYWAIRSEPDPDPISQLLLCQHCGQDNTNNYGYCMGCAQPIERG